MDNQSNPAGSCRGTSGVDHDSGIDHEIRARLTQLPYPSTFRQVSWSYDAGRLVLRGRVPSFYLKQFLQERLRDVEGVHSIVNEVQVCPVDCRMIREV